MKAALQVDCPKCGGLLRVCEVGLRVVGVVPPAATRIRLRCECHDLHEPGAVLQFPARP